MCAGGISPTAWFAGGRWRFNQLIQVFLNLISNAEHAIREVRGIRPHPDPYRSIGAYIAITVQDDGVGILPKPFRNCFARLYHKRLAGARIGPQHLHRDCSRHGGSIDVETLPVGGSAFTVFLPVASPRFADPLADGHTPALPRMRAEKRRSVEGRAILILDDEESIRMLLEEGLCPTVCTSIALPTPAAPSSLLRAVPTISFFAI